MKQVVCILIVFLSFGVYAQNTKPTFEKVGKVVKATYFHDNGEIAQTGYLLKGKLHGEWFMYDTAGKKIAEGNYIEGKKSGKWFFWNDNQLKEVDFLANKLVNVKSWNNAEIVSVER